MPTRIMDVLLARQPRLASHCELDTAALARFRTLEATTDVNEMTPDLLWLAVRLCTRNFYHHFSSITPSNTLQLLPVTLPNEEKTPLGVLKEIGTLSPFMVNSSTD